MVDSRKPIESYSAPLTDGPINAPKANVDVHRPDINPYVSMLSGSPCLIDVRNASEKLATNWEAMPRPCSTKPEIIVPSFL